MTEQTNIDAFEQLLSAEFERMVAGATDPKPAAEIADAAMRPRGTSARLRRSRNGRRLLLLGLAAAFLIPAAYLGALGLAPRPDDTTLPKPSLLALATHAPEVSREPDPSPAADAFQEIGLRRVESATPGIEVFAVRSDGFESVVRFVPDSILPAGHQFQDSGSVSGDGWLALADQDKNWPMVLIDLKDAASQPWIVNEASLGGISPAFGPGGLVAAVSAGGGSFNNLVIVDLDAHAVRHTVLSGSLIGGGPSIIWTTDGGILESVGVNSFRTHHLDGSPDTSSGFPDLYDGRQIFGPDGAQLQLCQVGANECPVGASPGGVRLSTTAGVSQNVYTPTAGGDRVLSAVFGGGDNQYWVMTDSQGGSQYGLLHILEGETTDFARINRASDWGSAWINRVAPDGSQLAINIDRPGGFQFVVTPTDGRAASLHAGLPAGFSATADIAGAAAASYAPPSELLPLAGQPYQLPNVDELIAAEKALNPGRVVHGQGSRDGLASDNAEHDYNFTVDQGGGPLDVYLDCIGPSPATVTVHGTTITSPCAQAGTYAASANVSSGEEITVHTTGDTSWRVVVYGMSVGPGDTPPPVSGPAST